MVGDAGKIIKGVDKHYSVDKDGKTIQNLYKWRNTLQQE